MEHNKAQCIFCSIDKDRVINENELAFAIHDGFPVTKLHTLVIPKRHAETYFDLTEDEREACFQLLNKNRLKIEQNDNDVDGFNVGMNSGVSAGQTVFHCHIHLIPRRLGDIKDPRGGVRGVIPDKRIY